MLPGPKLKVIKYSQIMDCSHTNDWVAVMALALQKAALLITKDSLLSDSPTWPVCLCHGTSEHTP